MSELRGILLLAGVFLILGIYAWGRWRSRKKAGEAKAPLFKPHLRSFFGGEKSDGENDVPAVSATDFDEEISAGVEDEVEKHEAATVFDRPEPGGAQKIVSLRVVAREGAAFSGQDLLNILNEEGLEFGEFDIFHKLVRDERARALFSIANLHEPGTFDLKNIDNQLVTGITLFMVLPGPQDGAATFSDMVHTARRIAATLGGELRDDQGSTFNSQRERSIREEIVEYQHLPAVKHGDAHV